ncbi:hypothetical protein FoTM2_016829 [Fusarium oxysporum f. sp. vasinfectum]|uniref:Uncharacterized protein n=1 Tax=Fusarium oxysporum f. sp. vasinfectum 25433 TaxID=1089449 RepID=X0KP61_FUSOX|nr:hypothetical protein FOTG_16294 [Fusarium oxysporum f. sp. vasinfectum 25433]EXM16607.1 hypothetical protein FOTG_15117 [Fusarium oxysporum f. sp. vasinfectum 25433]KAK2923307.1 hypothetical protein FoTM2_016829 [Fusarium oxysporum f. sp. vasinfectum]
MPIVPVINNRVFEIGSSSKESGTLRRAMALPQFESPFDATDDATAVDSDIDDYIGKSAIDDDDDSFD